MKINKVYLVEKTLEQTLKDANVPENEIDKAEQILGDDTLPVIEKGQLENALDKALRINRREIEAGGRNFHNVLLIGVGGAGKTARIIKWAKDNNINLVQKSASSLEQGHVGGAIAPDFETQKAMPFTATTFDDLDEPDTVLFLDEYNRGLPDVRGTLLTLIQDHKVVDYKSKGSTRFLPNLLFTIAAINPDNPDYNVYDLDDAEKTRFRRVTLDPDQYQFLSYLNHELERRAQQAKNEEDQKIFKKQKALANAVLGTKEQILDSAEDIRRNKEEGGNGLITSNRSFFNLLDSSEGDKEEFIKEWSDWCNDQKLPLIKKLLRNYKDIDDKANDALKQDTKSSVFGASQDNSRKVSTQIHRGSRA